MLPRVCRILDTTGSIEIKLEVIDTLKSILKAIDSQTLKSDIMKSLERLRANETDPKVCMKMLELYEEIGKVLGPEEVGMKILPGIIPMLIAGQFTKDEFTSLMSAVRRLLDQIEKYRLPTLPDTPSSTFSQSSASASQDPFASVNPKNDKDPLSFLNDQPSSSSMKAAPFVPSQPKPLPPPTFASSSSDPFASVNIKPQAKTDDLFAGINSMSSSSKA